MSWSVVTAVVMKNRGEPREMAKTTAKKVKKWKVPPAEQNYRTEAMIVKKKDVRWTEIKTFGLRLKSVRGFIFDKSHSLAEVTTGLPTF